MLLFDRRFFVASFSLCPGFSRLFSSSRPPIDQPARAQVKQKHNRHFEVVVAESAPSLCGHKMAAKLASLGIKATLIADSAVFAMMARANKVRALSALLFSVAH